MKPRAKRALRSTSGGAASAAYDVTRIRRDFPILHQKIHGKPLVYLDNAATTQKPQAVIDALTRYYSLDNSNVHRGVHTLSMRATQAYEAARQKVASFINAADPAEIVFVRGSTEGINLVACSYTRCCIREGDEVLITAMEHHSNIVPWQMLCEERGARLRVAPMNLEGELLLDEFEKLLTPKTRLVAVVYVSNSLGTVNPVGEIVALAHAKGDPRSHRRRPGDAAYGRRRSGARLRFLRLLRPQDVRPDGNRRGLRQARAPREDASLPGRRRHDRFGHFREDHLQHPPLQVRSGNARRRRGHRPRRRDRLHPEHRAAADSRPRARPRGVRHPEALVASRGPIDRHGEGESGRGFVRSRGRASSRRGNDSRPRGDRNPDGTPLHAAGHGFLRRPGDVPRVFRSLQHACGNRRSRLGDRQGERGVQ